MSSSVTALRRMHEAQAGALVRAADSETRSLRAEQVCGSGIEGCHDGEADLDTLCLQALRMLEQAYGQLQQDQQQALAQLRQVRPGKLASWWC